MPQIQPVSLCSVLLILTLFATTTLQAATLRTVALSGRAPGVEPGTRFFGFSLPTLNNSGRTAFSALLIDANGGISNDVGIWSEGNGSLSLVARRGHPAPDTGAGVTFAGLSDPLLNDAGQTVFSATVTGPGITEDNNHGFWTERMGVLERIVRDGDPATPIGPGTTFTGFSSPVLNDVGQTAFVGSVTGPSITSENDNAIWIEQDGGLSLRVREGSSAPGTELGVNFGILSMPAINNPGRIAFWSFLTGASITSSNEEGIWSDASGSLSLIAREGSPAPGAAGLNFDGFTTPRINDAGQTAFLAFLTGPGLTYTGVWTEVQGELLLVAREEDAAPGTEVGTVFQGLNMPLIDGISQVAFIATLTGPQVTANNNTGIWSGASGGLELVAREGNASPGTEANVSFGEFIDYAFNTAGQTAIHTRLTGAGVTDANDRGIWAEDINGQLTLIVREGGSLEVQPGEFRTVSNLGFLGSSGLGIGRVPALNEIGQIAFVAAFTDGSQGIFVSDRVAIPEPETLTLIAAGLIAAVLSRRNYVRSTRTRIAERRITPTSLN